jgi:protein TonB
VWWEVRKMTACASLRVEYRNCLRTAFLAAIAFHVVAFAFWPEYVPQPYRGTFAVDTLKVVKVAPYDIPPRPKDVEPPDIPDMLEASDDVDHDITISRTIFNPRQRVLKVRAPVEEPIEFIAFETFPELVSSVKPKYPELARKAEVEGVVKVKITIDETGRVISAWVAASDAPILNDAAVDAAYRFTFRPALQRGVPVKATIGLTFEFKISE